MEGLGYDDREISGLDTDTVVQKSSAVLPGKGPRKI